VRKIVESTLVSLDGVIERPDVWAGPLFDRENVEFAREKLRECDAFLFGRTSYEILAKKWAPIDDGGYLSTINRMPKYVASRTLKETTWNATLLAGDVAERLAELKRQPGKDIIKYGTTGLDSTLIRHGLLDELHVSIYPVVVGKGRRLFDGVDTSGLRLELFDTRRFGNGAVTLSYRCMR
jgi:dihydrofolate reductase